MDQAKTAAVPDSCRIGIGAKIACLNTTIYDNTKGRNHVSTNPFSEPGPALHSIPLHPLFQ